MVHCLVIAFDLIFDISKASIEALYYFILVEYSVLNGWRFTLDNLVCQDVLHFLPFRVIVHDLQYTY